MFIDALDPGLSGSLGYYLSEVLLSGGGYLYGKALRMWTRAVLSRVVRKARAFCADAATQNATSMSIHALPCGGGDYWNASTGSERTHYYSDVGRCLRCEAGTISMPPEPTPFVTTCVACDPGRYSEFEASVRCETCSEGRYAPSEYDDVSGLSARENLGRRGQSIVHVVRFRVRGFVGLYYSDHGHYSWGGVPSFVH